MKINNFFQIAGKNKVGKTELCIKLHNEYFTEELCKGLREREAVSNHINERDFIALYKFKGKIIIVLSRGDSKNEIKKDFEKLQEIALKLNINMIDICIFTTRTRGETCEFWLDIAKKSGKIEHNKAYVDYKIRIYPKNDNEFSSYLDTKFKELVEGLEKFIYKG